MTEKDHRIPNKPMSPCGPSRHFAATQDVCRFRSEADMSRLVRPGQSVENDPKATFAGRFRRASLSRYDALSSA